MEYKFSNETKKESDNIYKHVIKLEVGQKIYVNKIVIEKGNFNGILLDFKLKCKNLDIPKDKQLKNPIIEIDSFYIMRDFSAYSISKTILEYLEDTELVEIPPNCFEVEASITKTEYFSIIFLLTVA